MDFSVALRGVTFSFLYRKGHCMSSGKGWKGLLSPVFVEHFQRTEAKAEMLVAGLGGCVTWADVSRAGENQSSPKAWGAEPEQKKQQRVQDRTGMRGHGPAFTSQEVCMTLTASAGALRSDLTSSYSSCTWGGAPSTCVPRVWAGRRGGAGSLGLTGTCWIGVV